MRHEEGMDGVSSRDAVDADVACVTAPPELFATVEASVFGGAERGRRIVRAVEAEIIPRLMLLRRRDRKRAVEPEPRDEPQSGAEDVQELVRLLMNHDFPIALAFVEAVRERGVSQQDICLRLLAPAARVLGRRWEEDESTFMEVTVGLCRLHQVLHRLIGDAREPVARSSEAPDMTVQRALLAGAPGEQHTFGIVIVGQFLRSGGWDVWNEFPANDEELLDSVRQYSFDLVGLSVGTDVRLGELPSLLQALRRQSRNRGVCVMVGGPAVAGIPDVARSVGADATAADGREAAIWVKERFRRSV